jgi:hypothetical protein
MRQEVLRITRVTGPQQRRHILVALRLGKEYRQLLVQVFPARLLAHDAARADGFAYFLHVCEGSLVSRFQSRGEEDGVAFEEAALRDLPDGLETGWYVEVECEEAPDFGGVHEPFLGHNCGAAGDGLEELGCLEDLAFFNAGECIRKAETTVGGRISASVDTGDRDLL